MVSYMKKMIWGDQTQSAAARASEEEKDDDEQTTGTIFRGRVTPGMIVKQGWLFKRSRYM